jgi:uncharacterized protein YwgA
MIDILFATANKSSRNYIIFFLFYIPDFTMKLNVFKCKKKLQKLIYVAIINSKKKRINIL